MKKLILGVVLGVVLSIPVTAYAVNESKWARKIYRFDTENASVSVFDDGGNKCYVASRDLRWGADWGSASVSISCVKN